jgi:hypothetical protein
LIQKHNLLEQSSVFLIVITNYLQVELDKKRAKTLAEYNQEMTRINKIAGGARSMAEERKYDDEKKIREKAKKIRSTGKSPRGCCF